MNYINEAVVVVCHLLANDLKSNLEKKKRRRRMWVHKWISYLEEKGVANLPKNPSTVANQITAGLYTWSVPTPEAMLWLIFETSCQ
jgi:hypothetical protein